MMSNLEIHGNKIKLRTQKKATIVPLSGGIDSVYVLEKLLKETDDIILAHHIHLLNQDGRHKVEAERCRKIVDWCRKEYRPFEYSESAIDHRGLYRKGFDIIAVAFEVGIVGRSYASKFERVADRWIFGLCMEEEQDINRRPHIINACAASSFPYPSPELFRLPIISKSEQMRYMHEDLVDLCWTCREPIWRDDGGFDECEKCPSCDLMTNARDQLKAIPEGKPITVTSLENVFR
ncbi:hypothetical protein NBZ79_11160 [Sneathiella marina]|uniref:tRNA(Ile)-lysidine/2-thiocytidine synthase N-terminal domain-containing protein n=1 Tax=Sneathiella marina TaxID=2950108 RepID=A0ABY4VXU1_9PROT|nr:hypothetical protein [Sneathiella marina]USG59736.1 hypothetical protein NBZ79_11160 [Sneathiella marina]